MNGFLLKLLKNRRHMAPVTFEFRHNSSLQCRHNIWVSIVCGWK